MKKQDPDKGCEEKDEKFLSTLHQSCLAMFEIFDTLKKSGFSEDQAMILLPNLVRGSNSSEEMIT